MTTVYYPHTYVHPDTAAGSPDDAVWVDVSGGPHAYWEAMCGWWEKGEDFVVIEHDVVCRPDVLQAFEECPEPWCVNGYTPICHEACLEAWANMLGCTRFRAEIMEKCPDAISSIPPELRLWNNLCDHMAGNKVNGTDTLPLRPGSIRAAGYTHHWHRPPVRHHTWENDE